MPAPIHPFNSSLRPAFRRPEQFRQPHYECEELAHALKITLYIPGVEADGVEIRYRGPDLAITARKAHVVRVNFPALHLEKAQRDYRLRLRLGRGLDYDGLQAEIHRGVLTLILPKFAPVAASGRAVA